MHIAGIPNWKKYRPLGFEAFPGTLEEEGSKPIFKVVEDNKKLPDNALGNKSFFFEMHVKLLYCFIPRRKFWLIFKALDLRRIRSFSIL